MDAYSFDKWKKLIEKHGYQYVNKELFEFYNLINISPKYTFLIIDDSHINNALGNIGNNKKLIVSFDAEFQSASLRNTKYNYLSKKMYTQLIDGPIKDVSDKFQKNKINYEYAYFIRELGGQCYLKSRENGQWCYIGNFHINFPMISDYDIPITNMKYLMGDYSTTTKPTAQVLRHNDNYFVIEKQLDRIYHKFKSEDKQNKSDKSDNGRFIDNIEYFSENLKNEKKRRELIKEMKNLKMYLENSTVFKSLTKKNDREGILNTIDSFEKLELEDFGKQLVNLWKNVKDLGYNIFGFNLREEDKKIFVKQWETYRNDPDVKKRTIITRNARKIIDLLFILNDKGYFIVKGKRDLEALKNHHILFENSKYVLIDSELSRNIYDIEIFNGMSRNKFGSAKLEDTYLEITRNDLYKTPNIFTHIQRNIGESPHNPAVDSLFTTVVAVVINLILNYSIKK